MSRLQDNILKVGRIGEDETELSPKGISRLRNTPEYRKAAELTADMLKECGLQVIIDPIGNVRGSIKGKDNSLKKIALGSHLDTVLHGGLFDGNLGVMAAVECMYRLKEEGKVLRHPVEILGFDCEESSMLGGTFGSRAMMGQVNTKAECFDQILAQYGFTIEDVKQAKTDTSDYRAYLELHIEQGDRLDTIKKQIGIVTGIIGVMRYRIVANGVSNHAGTTMMENRKDALVNMSKLIVQIDTLAREYGDSFVATVGMLDVGPGAENVIPGRVEAILELRHMKSERYHSFIEEIKEYAGKLDVEFTFEKLIEKGSVECDGVIMDVIEEVCEEAGAAYIRMPSGAGHDANAMAHEMPVGMIFVPSIDGISHSRLESTKWEDIEAGADILYKTLLKLDTTLD